MNLKSENQPAETGTADRFRRFFLSSRYTVFCAVLIWCGHCFDLIVPFALVLVASMIAALFLCNDIRFFLMPVASFVFFANAKGYLPHDNGYERYLAPGVIIPAAVAAAVLIFALCRFAVRNWKNRHSVTEKKLFPSILLLDLGVLINGMFSKNYSIRNLILAVSFCAATLLVYWIMASFTEINGETRDYFFRVLCTVNALIAAELIWAFFRTVQYVDGHIVKESVVLGWGVWTHIGDMLAFLMPASFYFAHNHKKGWIGYLAGLLDLLLILLCQSRGALIMGGILYLVCVGVLCFSGSCQKRNRILTGATVGGGLLFFAVFFKKFLGIIQNFLNDGLDSHGRLEIWSIGWKHFCNYPIFGSGFYDSYTNAWDMSGIAPYLYHCTVIQFLAACGAVGLFLYGCHRVITVRYVLRYRNDSRTVFFGLCILGMVLCSLIDVLFFKLYSTAIYTVIILMTETDVRENSER